MGYGREIVKRLFGQRSKCLPVHYEFESKIQADSDRSRVRVFEVGLSAQRYGDFGSSEKIAADEIALRMIEIAREQGCFVEQSDW